MRPFIFFILLVNFCGCSNTLNTISGYTDTSVIYGFLSNNDTTTYIRVERAFVDPNKPSAQIAQLPDSLYYSDAIVTLTRVKTNEKFTLQRVDGNKEGYVRDAGYFASAPNYLYKSKKINFLPDETWRIDVFRGGNTKAIASATTNIVGNYVDYSPVTNILAPTLENNISIGIQTTEITGKDFDVNLNFVYDETTTIAPITTTTKTAVWKYASGTVRQAGNGGVPEPIITFARAGKDFFQSLSDNIPTAVGVTRTFKRIDVDIYAGGVEFLNYSTVGISNTGITGFQPLATYTNVTGGLGIFSSRTKYSRTGLILNDPALNLLKTSDLTKQLNFR